MMHVDAPHPNCAYLWLEHSINPKLQGDLAAWFGSVPAALDACQGNALLGDEGCAPNGLGNLEKISFWPPPLSKFQHQANLAPSYCPVTDYLAALCRRTRGRNERKHR